MCCAHGINVIPPTTQYDRAGPETLLRAPRRGAAFAGKHAEDTRSWARVSRWDQQEVVMLALNPVEGRPDNPDITPDLRKCRKVKRLCRKCRECPVFCTQRDDQREPARRIWPERQFPCRHCRGFAKPTPDLRQRLSAFGGVSQQGAEGRHARTRERSGTRRDHCFPGGKAGGGENPSPSSLSRKSSLLTKPFSSPAD